MSRTNIDLPDDLVDRAMRMYHLKTKREAVALALQRLVGEPMTRDEMLRLEGSGWVGDLGELASTDVILMEVLAGARSEQHAASVRRLLLDNEVLTLSLPDDAETAATIYRTCRRGGTTIRKLNDCLIAAVARPSRPDQVNSSSVG